MALLKFLKGNYSSLSTKAIAEGQVLICGDTGEMFVDVAADKRVKIGDFVVVSTVEALEVLDATVVPTSRLYYVEDGNILARSNGAGWVQINKQKTLAELGGVSATTYATDKAALVQADTNNATAISTLETYVGTFTHETAKTVVEYINAKTDGIATSGNLEALGTRVTAAEGKLETLTGADTVEGSVAKALKDAKAYTDEKDTAMNARMDTVEGSITTLNAEEGVAGSVKAMAKSYADGKDAAITSAQSKADSAYTLAESKATMTEVNAAISGAGHAVKTEVDQAISDLDSAYKAADSDLDTKLQGNIDKKVDQTAYDTKVGELADEDTRLAGLISDMDTAYKAADTALNGRVTTLEDQITGLSGAMHFEGVKAEVPSDVSGYEAGDVIIVGEKEYVFNGTAFVEFGDVSAEGERIGALETTVGKAAEGENPATGLVKSVADNAAAIAAEKSRAEGAEASLAQADTDNLAAAKKYADDAIIGLKIGDYAKKSDLDTHTGDTTIHITADERSKWNAAESKAHTHNNKALLDAYTQTEEDLADAVAKKHSHANAAELDKIQDGDVAKWNAAQANAEATAADALSTAKSELEGKITAAQTAAEGKVTALANGAVKTNADNITALQNGKADKATTLAGYGITNAYTKTETYTQAEVDALLTWGTF